VRGSDLIVAISGAQRSCRVRPVCEPAPETRTQEKAGSLPSE
jgi:hypothetical protein